MPSPMDAELRVQDSPVPTQIVFVFFGSIAMAPIDCTDCLSNTGLKVVPLSIDFQTPPLAAATKSVVFPPSLKPVTAEMRPLIVADPMLRASRPDRTLESAVGAAVFAVSGGGGFVEAGAPTGAAMMARATDPFCAGYLKSASSNSTFASACSTVMREFLGPPWRPDSMEKGIHTPATCA